MCYSSSNRISFFTFSIVFLLFSFVGFAQINSKANLNSTPIEHKMNWMLEQMKIEYTRYQKLEDKIRNEWNKYKEMQLSQKEKKLLQVGLILMATERKKEKLTYPIDSIKLSEALISFQKRHGMLETGKLSNSLIYRIISDVSSTQKSLKNSIRRLESIQFSTGGMVWVNIPEFYLIYFDSIGTSHLKCPVIVGKPSWPTMPLQSKIKEIKFCPYWNVPNSILNKEILPILKRNPGYLKANQMEWKNGKLRQKPGIKNALGLIKFSFDNPYHIYLHDTPNKTFFQKNKRSLSHGCIRLSCVDDLAMHLLRKDSAWVAFKKMTCESGRESIIKVELKTQIVIVYLTSWVDDMGVVQVRDDIYGWDK
jgi:murein L,D-transpeptidase YcbB/YkuD